MRLTRESDYTFKEILQEKVEDLWHSFVYALKTAYKRLYRAIYYAYHMNKDYDYDYTGIYKIIYSKLRLMEKEINPKRCSKYKYLQEARYIAKRLSDYNNYTSSYDDVVKQHGEWKVEFEESDVVFDGEKTYKLKKKETDYLYRQAYKRDENQRQGEHKRLFYLLDEHLQHWWD